MIGAGIPSVDWLRGGDRAARVRDRIHRNRIGMTETGLADRIVCRRLFCLLHLVVPSLSGSRAAASDNFMPTELSANTQRPTYLSARLNY